MYKLRIKKYTPLLAVLAALIIICLISVIALTITSNKLETQKAAERWQGESETEFAQISCFLPANESLTLNQVYELRGNMHTKLHEASADANNKNELISDAWSANGKLRVANGKRSGTVNVIAVGGDFFNFHPVRLISGNYLRADDIARDRVLLDKNTAWLLFGGTELTGMSFKIEGQPFVVAGVFEHESDRFSKLAYEKMYASDSENTDTDSSLGIFMSYDAYLTLMPEDKKPGISCYEIVMAEPVTNFAYNAVKEKCPVKTADIVDNSKRYELSALWKLIKLIPTRTMRISPAVYPYWENAAHATQDLCVLLLLVALLSGTPAAVFLLVVLIIYLWRGKTKLEEELMPKLIEQCQEYIRVRERRAWEKKHPDKH